jgi:uncharacterized YceG family protein
VSDWPERSDEEREAARRERERQRAERTGQIASPEQPDLVDDGEGEEPDPEDELPAGTKRISHLQRQRIAPGPPRKAPKQRPSGANARSRPRGGLRSWLVRISAVLALVLVAAVIWFLVELLQPFHGSGHGSVTVTIPPHSTSTQVGDLLERDGVIASSFFFNVRAALEGDRSKLRSGTYHLKLDMPYGDVLTTLTKAPPAAKVSNLTIAEGDTRAKIAALLGAQHIRGSYLAATRRSPLINLRAYGAPRSLPSLEGFLFPSTYQLRDPITVSDLIRDQLQTFKRRFATVNLSYARHRHLSPFDVLTIASMVQGEAQTLHDMPLISSVIYNRLHDGMLLGIDATTRYATGNTSSPLTVSQLNSASPYNTRVHPGLPLGPIDNPGLAAIEAAAHPAHTRYLYFVAKPCGNGASAFASSYAQFQRYVQRYQAARAARGGKSPTHC